MNHSRLFKKFAVTSYVSWTLVYGFRARRANCQAGGSTSAGSTHDSRARGRARCSDAAAHPDRRRTLGRCASDRSRSRSAWQAQPERRSDRHRTVSVELCSRQQRRRRHAYQRPDLDPEDRRLVAVLCSGRRLRLPVSWLWFSECPGHHQQLLRPGAGWFPEARSGKEHQHHDRSVADAWWAPNTPSASRT